MKAVIVGGPDDGREVALVQPVLHIITLPDERYEATLRQDSQGRQIFVWQAKP